MLPHYFSGEHLWHICIVFTRTLYHSAALSIKMSVLLYLPAFLVVLVKNCGLATTVRLCFTIFSVQVLFGYPFLREHPLSYVKGAFDFGRIFLYKWTVNWRFLSEDKFLDPKFAIALLVGHASVLVAFGLFRWCRSAGGAIAVLNRAIRRPNHPGSSVPVTADGAYAILVLFGNPRRTCRGHHNRYYLQPYWDTVRALIALSILFVVRLSGAFTGMENALSHRLKVRAIHAVIEQL